MNAEDLLERLARCHGIEPAYHDIWGNQHATSAETARALLRAMGVPADDPAAMRAALAVAGERPWREVLDPVLVTSADAPLHIRLHLPATAPESPGRWRLLPEAGEPREGTLRLDELAVLERREIDGVACGRYELVLDGLPAGYHRFELDGQRPAGMPVIAVPPRCYLPPVLEQGGRLWGPAVQLYSLRSARNWGIGDFTDLDDLARLAGDLGADMLGLSPLHALFPHQPERCSPYRPSSRLFRNVLYLDAERLPELGECPEAAAMVQDPDFQAELQALRESELVDYPGVAAVKLPLLERLHRHFRERHLEPDSERGRAFREFRRSGGRALQRHALFEALQEHFLEQDPPVPDWPSWPERYRRPDTPQVAAFAASRAGRIEFHAWLQWLVREQLDAAARRTGEMAVGLYQDLAVSVDPDGAEAWANQDLYAITVSIGAPPDDFNLRGQDWGLPPPIPQRLRRAAYAPFIATLRHNMRDAGALRIDHVMGLMRLFCVPREASPEQGAYVAYPLDDLLGILALESQRNRCLVIGEDLGTVPDALRQALANRRILSYRVLMFEKTGRGFRAPEEYPPQALATAGTHDLPTLSGFWEGRDLVLRTEHALFPSEALRDAQQAQRERDRSDLLHALQRERLLPEGVDTDPAAVPRMTEALAGALQRYLARSPAMLMALQLEDLFGQREQMNLPGTVDEYPNWRRKLSLGLERYPADGRLHRVADALAAEGRSGAGAGPRQEPRPQGDDPAVVPRASYRLQLNAGLTFADARGLVGYLDSLGISHCYASPCLKARPGSSHGYDIVDHSALNPELGARDEFQAWTDALHAAGMGLILDIVPNHMGVMGADNSWWLDVLEQGPASRYADFFDIDWHPVKPELHGKVLVPVLGDHYGVVLESGALRLELDPAKASWSAFYHEHRFPLDPATWPRLLRSQLGLLADRLGADHPAPPALERLAGDLEELPERTDPSRERCAARLQACRAHKQTLAALCRQHPQAREHLERTVTGFFNGRPGDAASFQPLHELLEAQAFRLAHWQVAGDEINYRRFFDVNELAGLRTENLRVFEATHRLVLALVSEGRVQGLRIDHPDGLYHPQQYLRRLRDRLSAVAPPGHPEPPVYLAVEKILAAGESLRDDWPVHGTTGYDFAALAGGLLVDPAAGGRLERIYNWFTGAHHDFDEILYRSRRHIMRVSLASELNVLANALNRLSESDWRTRDFTLGGLRYALSEILACFPVYRTYVTGEGITDTDAQYVRHAADLARRRNAGTDTSAIDFVEDLLLLRAGQADEAQRWRVADFAMRVQQYTAALMAKGLEDTALYRYHRLVSLNEVGGDPSRFGVDPAAFHRQVWLRAQRWPHPMLATSTHDAKRSEDVRARIDVLSELPGQWRAALARWRRLRRQLVAGPGPAREDEYLFYQTLVGTWPLHELDADGWSSYRERLRGYLLKAAREAKRHTSWIRLDEEYERALCALVDGLLDPSAGAAFVEDFAAFHRPVALLGALNSLSQCLLKLTCPGVPDLYQGTELWDFSLVDPDNRRPVDFDRRRRCLKSLHDMDRLAPRARGAAVAGLLRRWPDGRIKMHLLREGLRLRRRFPALFRDGDYLPLEPSGCWGSRIVAHARGLPGGPACIAVAPRLLTGPAEGGQRMPLGTVWGDTVLALPEWLAGRSYREALTGIRLERPGAGVSLSHVLQHLPLALLVAEELE
ncbi:MAG TPA: malto-oligosyltrehalose synthase [Gammaproteobacteria bacterium]|nr:malto-oligosyltrehalose synthase [Gammaproteobacteria bacterium]